VAKHSRERGESFATRLCRCEISSALVKPTTRSNFKYQIPRNPGAVSSAVEDTPEHLVAAPQTMALYWLEAPVLVRWSYGHHKYPFWSIVFTNVVKKERTEYRCGSSQTTVSHCSLAVLWDVWRSPTVGFSKSILKCLRRVRTTSRSLSASLGSRVRVAVVVITSYEKWTLRTLFPARLYRNWPSQRYNKVPQV
jgi:hypothetical protein